MNLTVLLTGTCLIFSLTTCGTHATEMIATDRYTLATVEPQGDQRQPLTTILSVTFGTDVLTLGDAITETLNGSGYRWAQNGDDHVLADLPLPSVVRNLGPLRLKEALETIAGSAWTLHVNELHRTVWFEVSQNLTNIHNL